MPKFLLRGRYTSKGWQGAVDEGFVSREAYIRQIAELMGSTVESVYWSFGDDHFYIVAEMPDAATAIARTLTTNLTGATEVHTTQLFSAAEMDEAIAQMPEYRAPAA